jgi:hypothetical protein
MSSDPMLPSVPVVSRRRTPRSYPKETPFAPGNVPNRLSNVRFSLIRKTTCSIGHPGVDRSAGSRAGAEDAGETSLVEAGSRVGDARCSDTGAEEHPAAIVTSTIDPAISRPAPNGERIITEHDWSIVEKVPGPTGAGQGAGVEPK